MKIPPSTDHPLKIDVHVHSTLFHTTRRFNGMSYTTPAELRPMYDYLGIEKGIDLPSVAPDCCTRLIPSEEVQEMVRQFPETYDWFCNIDPRWGSNSPEADLSQFILYWKDQSAKGVGEVTAHLDMTDPRVLNFFKHCAACAMPVTIHIGKEGMGDYGLIDGPGLPGLEQVLAENPSLVILGHSQNFWVEIGGDGPSLPRNSYPRGKVIPGGRVVSLMRRYPGLHGDLSAGSGSNAVMRDPDFGYAFLEEFQDRLYFGTDICAKENIENPMLLLSSWLDEAVDRGYISSAAYRKICRGNAEKILAMQVAPI